MIGLGGGGGGEGTGRDAGPSIRNFCVDVENYRTAQIGGRTTNFDSRQLIQLTESLQPEIRSDFFTMRSYRL